MTKQSPITVSEFLSAFYPDKKEVICLRTYKPKAAPKDFSYPKKWETNREALASDGELQKSLTKSNERNGVYFIVNAGGHEDSLITRFNAFFVESDNTSIEEQHSALDAAPLKTSIRVETSKSVHAYWLVAGDCNEGEWRDIQARLIDYFKGDSKICNPSRCMRLPHFNHVTYVARTDSLIYKKVEIAEFQPERRYSVEEMLAAFPAPKIEVNEQPLAERPVLSGSASEQFSTWDELNDTLRQRIMQAGRRNSKGKYEMRCPAHRGQGETSLFFNPANDAVKCLDGCSHKELLRAFGLPEEPQRQKNDLDSRASEEKASEANSDDAIDIDVCMADVEAQEVEWLIEPYIPLGKLTIVEGDPDEGKSFAMLSIATAVTKGFGLPFSEIAEAGNVIVLSAEDGRADTIRPRLDSLGADVRRVFAVKIPLVLDNKGFEQLEALIVKREAKLVLFDPLFAYVGGKTDINQDNKVRVITSRLADIAERHNCAIVALRHLPKAQQRNAKTAGISSIAWTAASRSVLLFGHDPDNEQLRGFVHTKHNLSKKGASQSYQIDEVDGKPRFAWTGECNLTYQMILDPQSFNGENKSELERAEDFLFDTLQGGAVLQKEVERRAKQAKVSVATLRRAKKNLNVASYKPIPKGAWWWKLPEEQDSFSTNEHVDLEDSTKANAIISSDAQAQNMSM